MHVLIKRVILNILKYFYLIKRIIKKLSQCFLLIPKDMCLALYYKLEEVNS